MFDPVDAMVFLIARRPECASVSRPPWVEGWPVRGVLGAGSVRPPGRKAKGGRFVWTGFRRCRCPRCPTVPAPRCPAVPVSRLSRKRLRRRSRETRQRIEMSVGLAADAGPIDVAGGTVEHRVPERCLGTRSHTRSSSCPGGFPVRRAGKGPARGRRDQALNTGRSLRRARRVASPRAAAGRRDRH